MSSPDPSFRESAVCGCSWFHGATENVSAVIERGSYPFPFRTRKSSPSSPMVPGPRVRESRSPLDSRPPRGKPPGGLFFFCPAAGASACFVAGASLAVVDYGCGTRASHPSAILRACSPLPSRWRVAWAALGVRGVRLRPTAPSIARHCAKKLSGGCSGLRLRHPRLASLGHPSGMPFF